MHIMFILSEGFYVAFCIFNECLFNICINSAFVFQLKHHKTKTNLLLPNPSEKIRIIIHTNTMQRFIALTFFRAEQTSVVFGVQTLPIYKNYPKQRQPRIKKQSLLTFYA